MNAAAHITVAPNGARLQKADHVELPMSAQELADIARYCYAAGAKAIHLHVRDDDGVHSIDPDRYRTAIAAVKHAAPDMEIQITTESAGRYSVAEQLRLLDDLKPTAASISVREVALSPELASDVYKTAQRHKTRVQHILYGKSCFEKLEQWLSSGLVPETMRDVIIVLGQYTPARSGVPSELEPLLKHARLAELNVSVCAFGVDEQACLSEAFNLGYNVRAGFENNLFAPNGTIWESNAQAVSSLRTLLEAQQKENAA